MNIKNCFKVFKFTVSQQMKGKAFKVSSTIILLSVFILVSLINIIPAFSDESNNENTETKQEISIDNLYFLDDANLNLNIENSLKTIYPNLNVTMSNESKESMIKNIENTNDKSVFAYIKKDNSSYSLDLYSPKNKELVNSNDANMLISTLSISIQNLIMTKEGLTPEQIAKVTTPITTNTYIAGEENSFTTLLKHMILPIIVCTLLFYIIYFYGYWVANSIVSEKTSRIMELLLTSTKPLELIVGKCVGMGVLAIGQFLIIIVTALASFYISGFFVTKFINSQAKMLDISLLLSGITVTDILWIIIFFVLGYTLYAIFNALAGATVSKLEDLNVALMPVSFISIISCYLAMFGLSSPDSLVGKIATYMPFSSPFFLPTLVFSENIAVSKILISVAILIATIILLVFFTSRVYSVVILQTGNRVTISDLFSIFKKNH